LSAPDPLLRIDDVDDDDKPFFLPTVPEPDAPDLRTDSANRPIAVALTSVALNHAIEAARRAVPPVTKRARTTQSEISHSSKQSGATQRRRRRREQEETKQLATMNEYTLDALATQGIVFGAKSFFATPAFVGASTELMGGRRRRRRPDSKR
jgi:hypothetical protein